MRNRSVLASEQGGNRHAGDRDHIGGKRGKADTDSTHQIKTHDIGKAGADNSHGKSANGCVSVCPMADETAVTVT